MTEDIINRLRRCAEIRRQIVMRKSVQEGKPDHLANLLEEAAMAIENERERCAKVADTFAHGCPGEDCRELARAIRSGTP